MLVLDLARGDCIERRENAIGKATSGAYTGNRILRGSTSIAAIPSAMMAGVSIGSLLRGKVSSRETEHESDHLCQGYARVRRRGRRKHRFCLNRFEPLGANFGNGGVGGRAKTPGPLPAWTAGLYAGRRHPRVQLEWALSVPIDVRQSAGPTCAPE